MGRALSGNMSGNISKNKSVSEDFQEDFPESVLDIVRPEDSLGERSQPTICA